MQTPDVIFAIIGLGALLAGILPRVLERQPLSTPIAFVALGMLVFALPLGLPDADPVAHPELTEHLTELGVIVALMGAGLKIDRPLSLAGWASTWRLLVIAMPVSIAAMALLGWWFVGLVPASALLLGAVLAPTDPVLASDVQVGEPTDEEDSEDEVRFALTSEAGLNDGLAFPFVHAAIAMAGVAGLGWVGEWVWRDLLVKIAVGVITGMLVGVLLGRLFFRARRKVLRLARHSEGFLALAATFLAYGVAEVAQGYGFLAVFVAARAIRAAERSHEYNQVLHHFAEQIERLLTVLLLLLFGGAVVGGLLAPLTWPAALVGLALLLVVRPLSGFVSLHGAPGHVAEHWVIAAFGIRGIGSFYYVAYALTRVELPDAELVWAIVGFVVLVSVVLHGIAATPVMQRLDRANERSRSCETPSGAAQSAPAQSGARGPGSRESSEG